MTGSLLLLWGVVALLLKSYLLNLHKPSIEVGIISNIIPL